MGLGMLYSTKWVTEVTVACYNVTATQYLTATCEETHKVSSISTQSDQNVKRNHYPLGQTATDTDS